VKNVFANVINASRIMIIVLFVPSEEKMLRLVVVYQELGMMAVAVTLVDIGV